jgi:FOG: Ankyrin repeat
MKRLKHLIIAFSIVGCVCVFGKGQCGTSQQTPEDMFYDISTGFASCPGTLHRAAEAGLIEIAQDLIMSHPNHVNARDRFDLTPLFYAAEHGHVEVARDLLANGAEPNALNDRDNEGASALTMAVQEKHTEVARALLEYGASPDGLEDEPWIPLVKAVRNNDIATVTLLLNRGANPNLVDGYGSTAIGVARHRGFQEILDLLESSAEE